MAGEAQSIKAQVTMPGSEGRSGLKPQLTLQMVTEQIRRLGLDQYTEEGLIQLAERYPTQALPTFRKNFNLMIQRVRQQRKKDFGQLEEEVTEIEIKETEDAESESSVGDDTEQQPVDDSTLLAHWALDEAEGIIAYDSAGVCDAHLLGDPVWQPDGGQVDGAMMLDGVNDYILAT